MFSDCEDLDDEESLRLLCHIFKAIVGLNDATLLEVSEREGFDFHVRFCVRERVACFFFARGGAVWTRRSRSGCPAT